MHVHRTVRGITLVVLLTGVLAGVGFTVAAADDDSRRRGHSDRSRDDDSGRLARAWRKLEQLVLLRVGQLTAQVRELTTKIDGLTQRANDTDLLAQRLNELATRITTVDGKIATVDAKIDAKVAELDTRITTVDGKIATVDRKIDTKVAELDTRIATVDGKIATVDRKIDAKVDELDVKVSGLDGRVTGQVSGLERQVIEGLARVTGSVGTLTERVDGLASSGLAVLDAGSKKVGDYVGMNPQGTLMIGMVVNDPVNPDQSYAFVLQLFPDRLVGNTIHFALPGCAGQAYVATGFPRPRSSLSLAGVREPGGIVYVSDADVSPGVAIQAESSIQTTSPHICVGHPLLNVQVLPAKPLFMLFALDPVPDFLDLVPNFPQRKFVRPFVVK